MTPVHPFLLPYAQAAVSAGFDVRVPTMQDQRAARFVYVTQPNQLGCALLQVPTFSSLGCSLEVSIPVVPSREHGSAVAVDFTGGPADLVKVLERTIASATVTTRFVRDPRSVAVDRRVPHTAAMFDATEHDLVGALT